MQSIYADGATHNDHHKEINIQGNVTADALEKLMKGFFAEDAEELPPPPTPDDESKPKASRSRVKPIPEESPRTREVFRLKNSTLPHMQLLWMMLTGLGWVKSEDMQAWLDLFGGIPNDCVVTWAGKVGVGTLKELIARMIIHNIIEESSNYVSIIESHFVDAEGRLLTNVKGGKPNDKTSAEIARMMPKLKSTYDITRDITEIFGDQRYGRREMMDDHKP